MYSNVTSGTIFGIQGLIIQVEADLSDGLPGFHMVGYLSSEIRESAERIRTALRNSGYVLPPKRIVVNLSPADIRKDGSGFDLPIAVAILVSMGCIPRQKVETVAFLGELGLNGMILPVNGVLPVADCLAKAGCRILMLAKENQAEASMVQGLRVIGLSSLSELVVLLNQEDALEAALNAITEKEEISRGNTVTDVDTVTYDCVTSFNKPPAMQVCPQLLQLQVKNLLCYTR